MPVLEAIGDGIWLVEGGIISFFNFPYPTRMLVIRLADGRLWVWSPIQLDDALKETVAALGPVTFLISPNRLHHLWLGDWQAAFPEAETWGPASTQAKRKDLTFTGTLEDVPPAAWGDEIDQAWFRGSPVLDEVMFFHKATSTAIIADMSENFSQEFLETHWPAWAREVAKLWRIIEPWGFAPLEVRLSFLKRAPARAALDKMLAWNPERVVMAHGEWQRGDGRAYLERAFSWLKR